MGFSDFLSLLFNGQKSGLIIPIFLILGVIFVNGWTDAPNAITASVSTGALTLRGAIILATIFNFAGAVIMGIVNTSVLRSIEGITLMINRDGEESILVLSAALFSIIAWAIVAWYFGIPTSESHALISGILGAAIAANNGINGLNISPLKIAVLGLVLSLPVGFILGAGIGKLLDIISFNTKLKSKAKLIRSIQRLGSAAMAFMHGAQDSQKFAGVFLAAMFLSGNTTVSGVSPIWLTLLCAAVISLGTATGGYRIIKRVGLETVELTPLKGLASDISGAICMLGASVLGIPVSTTHTATASVIGAGISSYPGKINTRSIKEMLTAWILTFPCCGALSFLAVKCYLFIIK